LNAILKNRFFFVKHDDAIGAEVIKVKDAGDPINSEDGVNFLQTFVFEDSVSIQYNA
jgi:hypothetical protein